MVVPKILHYAVELRAVRTKVEFSRPPVVYTNDLRSAEFQFEITDMNVTDLSTATATTLLYMRDGSFFQNPKEDVGLVGTTFSYTLKENEGNHAGIAKIQLIVTIGEAEYATQLYEFEIINGLESKVAQEVMIYDWTTLTRDARAYIDQFIADELLRDAEFDNTQFDRNAAFNQAQTDRITAYGIAEDARDADYEDNESLRQAGYDADHSRADTDHTRAEDDSLLAGTDHTRADSDSSRAGTDHTRAEADHTRADADNATVAGFNGRLTAEETATANNKVSAVKAKTFVDVDARLEDIEADGALMASNKVMNGDFSNGTTGWIGQQSCTIANVSNELEVTVTGLDPYLEVRQNFAGLIALNKYYIALKIKPKYATTLAVQLGNAMTGAGFPNPLIANQWNYCSSIYAPETVPNPYLRIYHATNYNYAINDKIYLDNVVVINLTSAFGAGNEPALAQMDAIMAKFENSWFDGMKNLFQAKASLNKLMALDARTEFEMRNYVAGGDFSNGANPLLGSGSNNVFTITDKLNMTGTANDYSGKYLDVAATTGDKLYISFLTTNVGTTYPNIGLHDYLSFNNTLLISPTAGLKSQIQPAKLNGIRLYIQQIYGTVYDNFTLDNLCVINLTKAFGLGKEPTLAEMDRLMARFPNSWFDGVKPIQTIETLYQEKANKVQEAWIYPTLLNGWVDYDSTTRIRYRKDGFGRVHLDGTAKNGASGQALFLLPDGYRLSNTRLYKSLDSSTQITSTGHVVHWSGSLLQHSLVGLSIFTD